MEDEIKKIALNDVHVQLGAKMMPFVGFDMPVRYSSDLEEHRTVREGVGVFDVSHMGEFMVTGPNALPLIQWISSNDASKLEIGQAQYAYFPNENGGIVDDLIIYKMSADAYMLVVNAANIKKDWEWINRHNQVGAELEDISDQTSLFAIQGPQAKATLQRLTPISLGEVPSYHFVIGELGGVPDVIVSATGYTGSGVF